MGNTMGIADDESLHGPLGLIESSKTVFSLPGGGGGCVSGFLCGVEFCNSNVRIYPLCLHLLPMHFHTPVESRFANSHVSQSLT